MHLHNFGYLDPGTGSLILQTIVGVLLGLVVVLRRSIGRLFGLFRPSNNKKTSAKKASKEDEV